MDDEFHYQPNSKRNHLSNVHRQAHSRNRHSHWRRGDQDEQESLDYNENEYGEEKPGELRLPWPIYKHFLNYVRNKKNRDSHLTSDYLIPENQPQIMNSTSTSQTQ